MSRGALGSVGDICYMTGSFGTSLYLYRLDAFNPADANISSANIVDDRVYFFQGNYSTVTYDAQSIQTSKLLDPKSRI